MADMHDLLVMLRPFLVVAEISFALFVLYAVRESPKDIAARTRFWVWMRCGLEAVFVLFSLYRVPYAVRVFRYRLKHETLFFNLQYTVGTALAFGVVVLVAWDCRRTWRTLKRAETVDSAK